MYGSFALTPKHLERSVASLEQNCSSEFKMFETKLLLRFKNVRTNLIGTFLLVCHEKKRKTVASTLKCTNNFTFNAPSGQTCSNKSLFHPKMFGQTPCFVTKNFQKNSFFCYYKKNFIVSTAICEQNLVNQNKRTKG